GGKAQLAGGLQAEGAVPADVEGPVQGQVHRAACLPGGPAGGGAYVLHGVQVQVAGGVQHAGDDAVGPGGHQPGGQLGHLGQLPPVVAEVPGPGAEQGAHRQPGLGFDLPDQGGAGGGAADGKAGAQLQPVGPAGLGGQGAGGAVHA